MYSSLKMIGRTKGVLAVTAVTLMATGCSTFRPMPTHGGGKRFDEEQRLVSATIQHATEKMDFARLRKSRIAIEVTSLPTSGGSDLVQYGSLKSVYSYNLNPKLQSKKNITRQDIEYLEKTLVRRLRFDGYQVTSPKDADIYLVVLVDSLGTNHNRTDYGILFRDKLAVSCEMTYYAINAKTQKMISSARSVASIGDYCEVNVRFTPISFNTRTLTDFRETIVPLPSTRHLAAGDYADAHVDALQLRIKPAKKGKDKGFRGKEPKFNLPNDRNNNGPDNGLLPPLPGGAREGNADGGTRQEKMANLIKQGYASAKAKDIGALEKIIDAMRKLKPGAPVIKKLEERLKLLKEKALKQPTPAEEPKADATMKRQEKMNDSLPRYLNTRRHTSPQSIPHVEHIQRDWWPEPRQFEAPDYFRSANWAWPLAKINTNKSSGAISYLELPKK